jgi:hypothetical protein
MFILGAVFGFLACDIIFNDSKVVVTIVDMFQNDKK